MIGPLFNGLVSITTSLRNAVLIAGLGCIVAITIPGFPLAHWRWVDAVLWFCLAFYALEWGLHVWSWTSVATQRRSLLNAEHVIDAVAVLPILVAHLIGLSASTVWLLGALWLLKLRAATSGFSLLGHVFMTEAKAARQRGRRVHVRAVHIGGRDVPDRARRSAGCVRHACRQRCIGRLPRSPRPAMATSCLSPPLGRLAAGFVMICGLAVFGLWTGILANGFAAETRRRDFVRTWEFVARVPFFSPLDPAAIIEIARMLRPLEVAERTVIIRKGRQGDCMYFIAGGEVEVAGSNPRIRLGPGAFFGELALLGNGIRTATVVATVPTTLLVLDLTDYRIFAAHYPELARPSKPRPQRRLAERAGAAPPPQIDGARGNRAARAKSPRRSKHVLLPHGDGRRIGAANLAMIFPQL